MCLICPQIGCRDTGHNSLEGERMWTESGAPRIAGAFRSMA
jgi:hypothetical protein